MPTPCFPFPGALRGALVLASLASALCAAPELMVLREGAPVAVSSLQGWTPSLKAEQFSVSGELAELTAVSYWGCNYTVECPDSLQQEKRVPWSRRVAFHIRAAAAKVPGADLPDALSDIWPSVVPDQAIVLAAWVKGGAIVHCVPLAFRGAKGAVGASFSGRFDINAGEEHGFALLLCWHQGRFVELGGLTPRDAARRAAILGDTATLAQLAKAGLDLSDADSYGRTLAHDAAGAGAVDSLRFLAERKVPLKYEDKARHTPLELAARRGRLASVDFLLKAGVKPGCRDLETRSPLFCASENGHLPVVKALLAAKADPDEPTAYFQSAISGALNESRIDVADELLRAKARFTFDSDNSQRVLTYHCARGNEVMARYFLAHGAVADFESDGRFPVIEAARKGSGSMAAALLKAGAKPNAVDEYGNTALSVACGAGNLEYVKALLEAGAKPDLAAKGGVTPLHAAARAGNPELVDLLLRAGAPKDVREKHGLTPLELAVIVGSWDAVERLVAAGCRIDLKAPFFGEQVESVLRGDQDILLAQLLQAGLAPDFKLSGEWSLRRLAALSRAERCERVLAEAGAPLDEAQPAPLARGNVDAGFKLLSNERPDDPRPDSPDLAGADLTLKVLVGPDGRPAFVSIEQCTERILCLGLTDTVKKWRFTPPTKDGKPVALWVVQEVHYGSMRERMQARPIADTLPKPIKQVKPEYPYDARRSGQMAKVVVAFSVTETGKVVMPVVLSSSGKQFEQPSLDAVRKWKFSPALKDGKPVQCSVQVPLLFTLN